MNDWKLGVDAILEAAAKKHKIADLAILPIPRLVVSLPFIAGCPRPDSLAKKNLDTLLKAKRKPASFPHRRGVSLRKRLAPVDNFKGAEKPSAAEKGMLLLELASLQDHFRDREADRASGKPNPLNEGMDYQAECDRLVKGIKAIDCAEIDAIITADAVVIAAEPGPEPGPWFGVVAPKGV